MNKPTKKYALLKTKETILSCKTIDQMEVANNMITAFDNMFEDYTALKFLDAIYSMHCDTLRK